MHRSFRASLNGVDLEGMQIHLAMVHAFMVIHLDSNANILPDSNKNDNSMRCQSGKNRNTYLLGNSADEKSHVNSLDDGQVAWRLIDRIPVMVDFWVDWINAEEISETFEEISITEILGSEVPPLAVLILRNMSYIGGRKIRSAP
jgi:hypothetical protein